MLHKISLLLIAALVFSLFVSPASAFAEKGSTFDDITFTVNFNAEETALHSNHKGIQAVYPCESSCAVTLMKDGTYSMTKEMHSLENDQDVSISLVYTFSGTYEVGKKNITLNPAETCTFTEDFGSLDGQSPVGLINNRSGDETSDPECLNYFDTTFIAWCGNDASKITVDTDTASIIVKPGSSTWEYAWNGKFEPFIANDLAQLYELRPLNEIVFYGASNFRLWKAMEEDMAPYKVQNHGVGGSIDTELMEFADVLLYPFSPKVVFIQTGSNDYTMDLTMEEVFANKDKMFTMFHENLPDAKILVMAGLPLPNRAEYWDLTVQVNEFLAQYCADKDYMIFVDGTDAMLTDAGPDEMATGDGRYFNPSIFVEDGIHLTQEGHDLWTPYMKAALQELGIEE